MTFHDCVPYYSPKQNLIMRLRQAKKVMEWCKGNGDYYTINRHKDHRESFWRKMQKLRPAYINENGVYVQPSMHDIDVIRRANTRMRRWFKLKRKYKHENIY